MSEEMNENTTSNNMGQNNVENPQIEEVLELKKQLETQKVELSDKEDRIKRLVAEFDNYKKRSDKERIYLHSCVLSDIVTSLLPAIDNLEKAASSETKDNKYKEGIDMVLKQFKDILNANGVEEIPAVGNIFDPELHEAVSSVEDSKKKEKEIIEEYRKGYKIGDKILRHSLVVVAN